MARDLQRLGPGGFQQVVAALAVAGFGPQVRPMGSGRDGGRDLLVKDGSLVWGAAVGGDEHNAEVWEGTTVFQVKHKERLQDTQVDAAWLWGQVRSELDQWADPDSDRGDVPHYLVFVTNVLLTPFPERGGFDSLNTRIRQYVEDLSDETAEDQLQRSRQGPVRARRHARRNRMRRLKNWRFWDGYQIDTLLNAHGDVRRGFEAFLTPGDILADLSRLSPNIDQEHLVPALRAHARGALLSERRVYFDEAGATDSRGVPVEAVAIDLPVLVKGLDQRQQVIDYVLKRGEHVLRPELTAIGKPRHLVLTGAPGNGKSTIAKFLTQVYRSRFVSEDNNLADEHAEAVERTAESLRQMGVDPPRNRRWAFNIDLARLAVDSKGEGQSLLHWIAARLTDQTAEKDIPRWMLNPWLKSWPSFIVLDGLDEVTEPAVRKNLIGTVEAFVANAEAVGWDILVLVTTRPTGYENDLPERTFERIDMTDLDPKAALAYARVVNEVRIPDDAERRANIIAALDRAAHDESTKHLLRTPLQTLIMSIIAETSPNQFAPSRYALFWGYYTTVAKREQSKESSLAPILRKNAQQILHLHQLVGLRLQQQAETATGSDAVMAPAILRAAAWKVLHGAGFDPDAQDARLLDQIVQAATHRLVLIAPRNDIGYGFDVRSLQELMAAHALTTGELGATLPRLRRIAASPHWRNTLLFAAGRYFHEHQPHAHDMVTDLVLTLDQDAADRLGTAFPVGPGVAAAILDDGMVTAPRHSTLMMQRALEALHEPGLDHVAYTQTLLTAASTSPALRAQIADSLRSALVSNAVSMHNATQVRALVHEIGAATGASASARGLASVGPVKSPSRVVDRALDWERFEDDLHGLLGATSPDSSAYEVVNILKAVEEHAGFYGDSLDRLVELIDDPNIAAALDLTLPHLLADSPTLGACLRHDMMPGPWRRPVNLDGEDPH